MSNYHIFNPRVNDQLMNPAYYSSSYTPTGGAGTMANPFNINSTDSEERASAYLWGRWHEAGTYNHATWQSNDRLGFIYYYINTTINTYSSYMYYKYWLDAPLNDYTDYDGDSYHYYNNDGIGRYTLAPGAIAFFANYDTTLDSADYIWRAGIVEGVVPGQSPHISNMSIYDVYNNFGHYNNVANVTPTWGTPDRITLTSGIHMGTTLLYLGCINNYFSTLPEPQNTWPIVYGRPIGIRSNKIPWFFNKRFNDQRRGLILDGPD